MYFFAQTLLADIRYSEQGAGINIQNKQSSRPERSKQGWIRYFGIPHHDESTAGSRKCFCSEFGEDFWLKREQTPAKVGQMKGDCNLTSSLAFGRLSQGFFDPLSPVY